MKCTNCGKRFHKTCPHSAEKSPDAIECNVCEDYECRQDLCFNCSTEKHEMAPIVKKFLILPVPQI